MESRSGFRSLGLKWQAQIGAKHVFFRKTVDNDRTINLFVPKLLVTDSMAFLHRLAALPISENITKSVIQDGDWKVDILVFHKIQFLGFSKDMPEAGGSNKKGRS